MRTSSYRRHALGLPRLLGAPAPECLPQAAAAREDGGVRALVAPLCGCAIGSGQRGGHRPRLLPHRGRPTVRLPQLQHARLGSNRALACAANPSGCVQLRYISGMYTCSLIQSMRAPSARTAAALRQCWPAALLFQGEGVSQAGRRPGLQGVSQHLQRPAKAEGQPPGHAAGRRGLPGQRVQVQRGLLLGEPAAQEHDARYSGGHAPAAPRRRRLMPTGR